MASTTNLARDRGPTNSGYVRSLPSPCSLQHQPHLHPQLHHAVIHHSGGRTRVSCPLPTDIPQTGEGRPPRPPIDGCPTGWAQPDPGPGPTHWSSRVHLLRGTCGRQHSPKQTPSAPGPPTEHKTRGGGQTSRLDGHTGTCANSRAERDGDVEGGSHGRGEQESACGKTWAEQYAELAPGPA